MTQTDSFWGLPDPDTPDGAAFYDNVTVKRLLAWVVDIVVVTVMTALIVPFTAFTALFFLPLLFFTVDFLYRWVTISRGSATWGMRLMSVELRDRQGGTLDAGAAALHTIGYVITMATFLLQLLSIALMLISARGQGLTDHVLGTAAINRAALR